MGTTVKEMEIKRMMETLFKVKVEAVVNTLANTLVVVVHQTVKKNLPKWRPDSTQGSDWLRKRCGPRDTKGILATLKKNKLFNALPYALAEVETYTLGNTVAKVKAAPQVDAVANILAEVEA